MSKLIKSGAVFSQIYEQSFKINNFFFTQTFTDPILHLLGVDFIFLHTSLQNQFVSSHEFFSHNPW